MYVAWARVFPYGVTYRSVKTAVVAARALGNKLLPSQEPWVFAGVPPDSLDARRVRPAGVEGKLRDPVVLLDTDVRWSFAEHCRGTDGCLAVEYAGRGEVGRTWPFRAGMLADVANALPRSSERTPGVASADIVRPFYATPYAGGDLLVSFWYPKGHFPPEAGVGRVGGDGQLRWFTTKGYSHHEAHVAVGDTAWIPGMTLEPIVRAGNLIRWECPSGSVRLDRVNVLDENGTLVDSVSVFNAFLQSEWAAKLLRVDHCDPFHLNSVSLVGEDVSGLPGVRQGDLVLSLRNLSAFVVVDKESRVVKRYAAGTWAGQHSVKHLGGSEFVMFDNEGVVRFHEGRWVSDARVLVVDLASGEETVLFPNDPGRRRWTIANRTQGRISVSPDRTRVLASYTKQGVAFEVRVAGGAVLAEFDFVHDARRLGRLHADSSAIRTRGAMAFYAREAR